MHRRILASALASTALVAAAWGLAAGPALAVTGLVATEDGPAIDLTLTVYAGTDGGASCHSALDYAEAAHGDPVTFCYTVVNTGTTHLASIVVSDAQGTGVPAPLAPGSMLLAPGEATSWFHETVPPADEADGVIDDTHLALASATALPVDGAGAPVPGVEPVLATAEAVVYPPEIVPVASMTLATSVYAGTDGGVGCPAAESTIVEEGTPVTFCHLITNTGTTYLDLVTIAGTADLGASGPLHLVSGGPLPLAPGASALFHLDGVAPAEASGEIAASATVTAAAVDSSGAVLAGVQPATITDGALVQVSAPAAPTLAPVVPAPAPAPVAPAPVAPAPARAEVVPPSQLAFTGWATWLLAGMGAALVLVGWYLIESSAGRSGNPLAGPRALRPAPVDNSRYRRQEQRRI